MFSQAEWALPPISTKYKKLACSAVSSTDWQRAKGQKHETKNNVNSMRSDLMGIAIVMTNYQSSCEIPDVHHCLLDPCAWSGAAQRGTKIPVPAD